MSISVQPFLNPFFCSNFTDLFRIVLPLFIATAILFTSSATNCDASSRWKERKWSKLIQKNVKKEEITWLQVGDQKILALYQKNRYHGTQGGAILIHDFDTHPNWHDVIAPLRTALPDHGWHTLSIQMPLPESTKSKTALLTLFNEAKPRISAGLKLFKESGIQNIVLIGHGIGATLATSFTANSLNIDTNITAVVGISIVVKTQSNSWLNPLPALAVIPVAVLDIYGEYDLSEVTNTALLRRNHARMAGRLGNPLRINTSKSISRIALKKTGNLRFRQIKIPGANHIFYRQTNTLIKKIYGWLNLYAAGLKIPVKNATTQ